MYHGYFSLKDAIIGSILCGLLPFLVQAIQRTHYNWADIRGKIREIPLDILIFIITALYIYLIEDSITLIFLSFILFSCIRAGYISIRLLRQGILLDVNAIFEDFSEFILRRNLQFKEPKNSK